MNRKLIHAFTLFFTILCFTFIAPVHSNGDSLSRFLLEKYAFINVNSAPSKILPIPFNFSPDIYTGDFPLIISYDPYDNGLTFFTGMPRFFPFYIGIGRNSEIGYKNMYSRIALIQSTGFGSKLMVKPFKSTPYLFLSSKFFNFSVGATVYMDGNFNFTAGYFLKDLALSFQFRNPDFIKTNITFPFYKDLALRLSGIVKKSIPSIEIGIGSYRTDLGDEDHTFNSSYKKGAHRGSLQLYPENSYSAFNYAKNQAFYDFIEFDIYKTKDGRYVVVHDPILVRYTGELKRVQKLTLSELKKRDFAKFLPKKFRGTKILTMEEVGKELADSNKNLVIEIKGIGREERDVVDFLDKVKRIFGDNKKHRITFLAMDKRIIGYLKKHTKKRVAFLYPITSFSSFFPLLLEPEVKYYLKETGADMIFFYTGLLERKSEIENLSHKYGFDFAFWNFHDVIYEKYHR